MLATTDKCSFIQGTEVASYNRLLTVQDLTLSTLKVYYLPVLIGSHRLFPEYLWKMEININIDGYNFVVATVPN